MATLKTCDKCDAPCEDAFEVFHRVIGHRQACSLACAKKVLESVAAEAQAALDAEAAAVAALQGE